MSQPRITHLYRSVLRELRLSSHTLRATRNPSVQNHIRALIDTSSNPKTLSRALLETRDFLRANRIHADLLKRYNPVHGMTQQEKVAATARRVGLNAPEMREESIDGGGFYRDTNEA
ncbi:hypothetical protein L204_101257 [Cryptococcus depauperatus]